MEEPQQSHSQPQSINEIQSCYEDEWLLIKILDMKMPFGQAPGVLLAHGPDRKGIFRAELKVRKHDPSAALTVVHGGKDLHDGAAFRRELARIAAEEEWVSVNAW